MSLGACLTSLVARKAISQARAEAMRPVFDELVAQYEPRVGRAAAESMASDKVMAMAAADHLEKRRTVLLTAEKRGTIYKQAKHVYRGGTDGPVTRQGLLAHLVKDQHYGGIVNVELQQRLILNDVHRLNLDLLNHFRHNLLGTVRHKADLLPLTQALHGEKIADTNLKELADAAQQANEWLRSRFNDAGGHIPKLEGWGVPHNWDAYRVGSLTPQQWIDAVAPHLDRAKMIDFATGEPLADGKLEDVLRQAYDSITSGGANKRTPGAPGGKAWSNRYAEHRTLHFTDAEAWHRVNERFGTGTVLDALHGHWDRMARAIGAMDVLGPNPPATIAWMKDVLRNEADTAGTRADRNSASVGEYEIDKVWDELTGANRRAVRPNVAMAFSTVRNYESAARLGFSPLSAMSDHATRFTTNLMSGMPITLEMGRYFKQLNPLAKADRDWARRNLIVSHEIAGRMGGLGRMHMDDSLGGRLRPSKWNARGALETSHEISRRLSDTAMRLSGLTPHTVAAREAGAWQFIVNLSHHAPNPWQALDGDFRAMLQRHGFGEGKWDQLRATPRADRGGLAWILPDRIEDRDLREQVQRALFMEADLGTPTGGAMQSAMMRQGRPGTFMGEAARGAVQFKMFPVVVVAEHAQRMMSVPTLGGRAKYAAAFFGSSLIMGALSAQLYELWHGRTPLDMTEPSFWVKASLRSGGLGVYGDAIKASRNEFGQSLSDMTAGPQLTTAQNAATEAWASADQLGALLTPDQADDAKARVEQAKSLRNLARREVPVLNSWYTDVAYERLLVDTLFEQTAGDPAAVSKSYRATEQYARDQGNKYWAPPGQGLQGMRAPDLGDALGKNSPGNEPGATLP